MKKTKILICFLLVVSAWLSPLSAQNLPYVGFKADSLGVVPAGYELVDSLVYRPASAVDTALVGKNIMDVMPKRDLGGNADVNVMQSENVNLALAEHMASNVKRKQNGYRVRIFFDNKQSARLASEETLKRFESMYHDVVAYRTYANPYFKVTVGDFRTKSEAMALLERIRYEFPSAFVVKENISFPVVDQNNAFVVDTLKVLRPIQ